MPISKTQYGVHPDVLYFEFGLGDIMLTRAVLQNEEHESIFIFSQAEVHEIGAETDEHKGKVSDDLPNVQAVFRFKKPESITALIHSLVEIQKEVFRAQNKDPQ